MESFFFEVLKITAIALLVWGAFYGAFRFFGQTPLLSFWLSVAFGMTFVAGILITTGLAHMVLPEIPNRLWGGPAVMALFPVGLLVALNMIATPALYFVDKRKSLSASENVSRIPEFALHSMSFIGGAVGALFSQQFFRHKTQKRSFQIIFYLSAISSLVLYYFAARLAWMAPGL